MIDTEVLVAGCGPCGLMLAIELGRRGIRTLLVDPRTGPATFPQANATQARTMEHFRRLGIANEVRELGLPADHPTDIAYFTRYTGHELARLALPTARQAVDRIKTMGGSWSAAELPHRISQKFVEAILLRHAASQASVDLRWGWQVTAFDDDGGSVHADIASADGARREKVRARFLIGADGGRSFVRRTLGIPWAGATGAKRDFMGGQMFGVHLRAPAFYDAVPHARAWMYVTFNHERRAFCCSIDGQAEFAFHAALHDHEDGSAWGEREAREVFAQAVGREIPIEVLSVGTWTAGHSLVAQSFGRGRVLLAGDAAHLFTPTGGLGYNTAVEDAVNLAWKLASVVRGLSPGALLETYELERKPLAIRNTGYARSFADSVGLLAARPELEQETREGADARAAASMALNAHVRLEFNIPGVTFGGRYDGSPLIAGDGCVPPADAASTYVPTACPGGRPPHAWLDDGRSLYDTFHAEWTLLVLGDTDLEGAAFVRAAAALRLDLRVVRHPSTALRALYEAPLALIRPDQIVAWRGTAEQDAEAVLRKATGNRHPQQVPNTAAACG